MRYRSGLLAAALLAGAADAQGLATKDLTQVRQAAAAALGPGYDGMAEPKRVTLACPSCSGSPIVDILMARQADGTEERVRSGATSMAGLQRLCRLRSPQCTIAALDVAPAMGWVSGYRLSDHAGSTAIILLDGDLLTIRAIATGPAAARRVIDRLLPLVRTRIIGR